MSGAIGRSVQWNSTYIGTIKDRADVAAMGRMRVWIPELCGPETDDNEEEWILVSYASPMGGSTDSGTSYGMWALPETGTRVAIFFANGDPANGYWFAALHNEKMNQSLIGPTSDGGTTGVGDTTTIDDAGNETTETPAILATTWGRQDPGAPLAPPTAEEDEDATVETTAGEQLVSEWNRNDPGATQQEVGRPAAEKLDSQIEKQGLRTDASRGISYSSPRRIGDNPDRPNDPAKVYGMSSPGGHHFVFDDGRKSTATSDTVGSMIRIRTSSGAQILMDDTQGFIYFISKDGNTWIEMTDQDGGNIDLYSAGNISLNSANGDVNIKAKNNINLEADNHIQLTASQDIIAFAKDQVHVSATSTMSIESQRSVNIKGYTTVVVESIGSMHITSGNQMNLVSEAQYSVWARGDLILESEATINNRAGTDILSFAGGNYGVSSAGNIQMTADGLIDFNAGTTMALNSAGTYNITATDIMIDGNLDIANGVVKFDAALDVGGTITSGSMRANGTIYASGDIDQFHAVSSPDSPGSPINSTLPSEPTGASTALKAIPADRTSEITRIPGAEPWATHTYTSESTPQFATSGPGSSRPVNVNTGQLANGSAPDGSYPYSGELYTIIKGLDEYQTRSYLGSLGTRESNNNYRVINSFGYLGKYQFGAVALLDIGYLKAGVNTNYRYHESVLNNADNWTGKNGASNKEAFLGQVETQERAVVLYTNKVGRYVSHGTNKIPNFYSLAPPEIGGYLMAGHLKGHSGAKNLYHGSSTTDGYGSSTAEYYQIGYNAVLNASGNAILAGYQPPNNATAATNSRWITFSNSVINNTANPNGANIAEDLMKKIESIARHWGMKLHIISGYRSPQYNDDIGGADGSRHLSNAAVDIDIGGYTRTQCNELIQVASFYGIEGIGIYTKNDQPNSLHFDLRGTKNYWGTGGGSSYSKPVASWVTSTMVAHLGNAYSNFSTVAGNRFDERDETYANIPYDPAPGEIEV